jgi:hypothetical protein
MNLMLIIILAIEAINVVLLLGLLHVYIGSYRRVKSQFTKGLIFFSFAFLVKSIALLGSYALIINFIDTIPDSRGVPLILLLVNIIECAGLVILLKISWD